MKEVYPTLETSVFNTLQYPATQNQNPYLNSDIALADFSHVESYSRDHVLVELPTLCQNKYRNKTY